ncbi:nucleoside ABC transporter membrane protein [Albimonas donghaensis]|uniref:Nucleoside ABC transporter membrane protein n=1 Tax=Albimonas donghaensis TaxID=356660 RepID=A0A1H3ALK3_9RHOB|nr:ABC transporter permease [Albimonas donghaensis]SDX30054.1 nucleoside ABC transporter membrane protein [Albimonas donghaensis]
MFDALILMLDSTVRLSTPLLLTALAGLYAERSGVFDIGLEGKLLIAAFAAAATASVTGSAWLGALAGMGASILFALLHGLACITYRGNQIVSGVAINFLAAGLTALLGTAWFHQGGRTPPLMGGERFQTLQLPFAESLADVPVIGGIYSELLSGHYLLVYVAFAAAPFSWWVLYRTRFGLRLRAVGENPAAVDTAGISVVRMRYLALVCAGVLCGLAGAYLAVAQSAGFIKDMSAGKGFIALAALIFSKWRPIQVMFACLLFGFLDAAAIRLQGQELPLIGAAPVQLIQALPYILTVVLLAGFIGKAVPPKAGGTPYVKER